MRGFSTRRQFLCAFIVVSSGTLLAACGQGMPTTQAPTQSQPAPQATTAPAQPTRAAAQPTAAPAAQATTAPAPQPTTAPAAQATAAPAAAKKGGVLLAGWEAEPGALENDMNRGAVTRVLLHELYDRLVERDVSIKSDRPPLVPGLATEWKVSDDARVYTFTLRQGIKFHDGTPFDAEAVKFNIERNWKKDHPFYYQAGAATNSLGYSGLANVEALNANTVRITHKDPFADFLTVLAFGTYSFASPTAIQKLGNEEHANKPVGTGPFKFVERQRGVKLVFERNPDYWGKVPPIDGFVVRPLPEAVARVTALETGEVDWVNAVHPDSIERVRGNQNLEIDLAQLPNSWGYIPNHKISPTNDRRFRQALNYAVDRETLARDIMKGLAVPATGTHAPGSPGFNPNLKGYTYDPAKAKQLLAEAGIASGFAMTMNTPAGAAGSPFAVQMNEFIQHNFKEVGLDVKIVQQEGQTYQSNLSKGIPDDVALFQVGFNVDEFANLQRMFRTDLQPPNGNTNPGWYGNAEMDALLKKAMSTPNEEERKKIYYDIQQRAVEDAAWIFVVNQKGARAWHKKVKGFVNAPSYTFTFRTVSIE